VDYDVIIAEAGPAGTVVAYLLTQRGLSVRLIENARMPRSRIAPHLNPGTEVKTTHKRIADPWIVTG
jgi:flavin-dependent dehydrogenase